MIENIEELEKNETKNLGKSMIYRTYYRTNFPKIKSMYG